MTVEVVEEHSSSASTWRRRITFMVGCWVSVGLLMVVVAYAVTSLLTPDPLPDGARPDVSTVVTGPDAGELVAPGSPLEVGTCVDVPVRVDDGVADPVLVVGCDEPHLAEVVAQLPGATAEAERVDACRAALAAAGVPVGDPSPPVPFRVGAHPTPSGAVECTLNTGPVTGSVTTDGYDALEPAVRD